MLLAVTPDAIVDGDTATGRVLLVEPTGDGEFRAACPCGWRSFGTYANPRSPALASMFENHACPEVLTGDDLGYALHDGWVE